MMSGVVLARGLVTCHLVYSRGLVNHGYSHVLLFVVLSFLRILFSWIPIVIAYFSIGYYRFSIGYYRFQNYRNVDAVFVFDNIVSISFST
jgi:hypothetical protein